METNNIINSSSSIKQALEKLNNFSSKRNLTLFVINDANKLVGTLTDGDIRRGLLQGKTIGESVDNIMYTGFRYLQRNNFTIELIEEFRKEEITLIPFVNENFEIERIIDFTNKKSVLPIDAVIMAGGEGQRLRPLTLDTPKPLIKVGDKPIIEYNIDRLGSFGVDNIHITVKYLGEKIKNYFKNGSSKSLNINYTDEKEFLGTIGALSLIDNFIHDYILVMNSDLLTNIDFEDFFKSFYYANADFAVATIPYQVTLPYGVIESESNLVKGIKEKPTYTYYSNAGIYLLKREVLKHIPKNTFFNATDLIQFLIDNNKIVLNYPILGYWLDIGNHEDYAKAQEDIKHLKF